MLSPIKGHIPSHFFMTVTFKAWKFAVVWWMKLLRNPNSAVSSFPWQMPYSMKWKSIGAEEPVLPFWLGWGWSKKPSRFLLSLSTGLGQSWDCFTAVTRGAVLFWHSYIVLQHNASTLLKVKVEGRTISFLSLLLCPNWRDLCLQQHYARDKEFMEKKKKKKSLMTFLFKKNFKVFKIQGDLCLWHSLVPRFFL